MDDGLPSPVTDPLAEDVHFIAVECVEGEALSTKKRKVLGRKCSVCMDDATGYHYRVPTCEGCKGFFRRAVQKKSVFVCVNGGNCVIHLTSRTRCQKCRYDKCINVGMAPQLVMNDKERAKRRQCRMGSYQGQQSPTEASLVTLDSDTESSEEDAPVIFSEAEVELVKVIYDVYQSVFTRRMHSQKSATDVERIGSKLANLLAPSISRAIDFAQKLPGFSDLIAEDRINLLQACTLELLVLRAASRYDLNLGFPLRNTAYLHRNDLTDPDLRAVALPLFELAESLGPLDEMDVALTSATLVFQMFRPDLQEPEKVEELLDNILNIGDKYYRIKKSGHIDRYANIILHFSSLKASTMRLSNILNADIENTLPLLLLHLLEDE